MNNERHKIWHSDRSPLEEQFCIFKMAAKKTRHNKWAVKIQHCPISSKFDMWVDNDVPNWLPTLKNFYRSPFSKWPPQIQHCPILTTFHMLVDYDVPKWFLTSKNFYWSPFLKWPPQYCTNSTLSDFNAISNVGRLWCPELIPDFEEFQPVAIFKMAATILHKFNIVRIQRHFICG